MADAGSFGERAASILGEQAAAIALVDERSAVALIGEIGRAERIFVLGEGRSGLVGRMFAMRLMHLGYRVHVVGETTTPAIGAGDVLIAISGSGETGGVVLLTDAAKRVGARIVAITANAESRLAAASDVVVPVPVQHKLGGTGSQQYGGSLFEQTTLLLFETVVGILATDAAAGGFEELARRHANLE